MSIIHAIFENGVFRPVQPVELPENCKVEFEPRVVPENTDVVGTVADEVFEILNRRHNSGFSDTAERHNEHQP